MSIIEKSKIETTTTESTAAIRAAAQTVMVAVENGMYMEDLCPKLEDLRDMLATARKNGVAEADIEKTLEDVRAAYPDVVEPWAEILEQITVFVWLKDPDGNRVRGDTVVIDRIIWENHDEDLVLGDTIQGLRDDLEADWEVVVVATEQKSVGP